MRKICGEGIALERFTVTGMSCAACSMRVEKAVRALDGVTVCNVNLLTGSMEVDGTCPASTVIAAVEQAGYGAFTQEAPQSKPPVQTDEVKLLRRRLVFSVPVLLLLLYVSMGHTMAHLPLPSALQNPAANGLLQLLLSASILLINRRFFIGGAKAILHRAPNMDTLVSMGSGVSFIYSVYLLFACIAGSIPHPHYYFESAAMILTLITVGKLLEALSKGRTTDALKSLSALKPQTAVLLRGDTEVTVPIERVQVGDIFVVRPGERIPADGIVLDGSGTVDESALTGESIPADKSPGDSVSAATVNLSGYLRCCVAHIGIDTTFSQILRMVEDASAGKAPIARTADRVSAVFVPTVLGIAAVTLAAWLLAGRELGFALSRAIAVLVISCPCALGLATPVAIMVGSGVGAKQGTLFKTAAALECAGRIQIVALDKTGTLTAGKPIVTDILPADGFSERELLTLAASLEQRSEHPLGAAILQKAQADGIPLSDVTDFEALPGKGLRATLNGKKLSGGSRAFIGIEDARTQSLFDTGKTLLYFALDGQYLGAVAVADTLRPDSAEAVRALQKMGIRTVMLTGDNARTAEAIAQKAGIAEVFAELLPGGKEEIIRKLRAEGRVAMVGDGINDAPALTAADLGMAIGSGTDIAADSADVVLLRNGLQSVPDALHLGKAVLRNIYENLFWAFLYNCIGIPLAAGVFIPLFGWELQPMFGAAAMSLSSFCVVTNALRLNLFQNHRKIKENQIMEKKLKIEGMMCGHCEAHVKKALEAIPQITEAIVSHEKGTAIVRLQSNVADDVLKTAVENEGYKVIG